MMTPSSQPEVAIMMTDAERKTQAVAIDIDGTLADYSGGWKGITEIGRPFEGAKEFLDLLRAEHWSHACGTR